MKSILDIPLSTKKACEVLACDLFTTFFQPDGNDDSGEAEAANDNSDAIEVHDSDNSLHGSSHDLAKELNAALEKETQACVSAQPQSIVQHLKELLNYEFAGYERNSILGGNLQKLLTALKSIQPTSTESERVFSLAANICTKKRTRLSDRSLNNICFLKSYFLSKKE